MRKQFDFLMMAMIALMPLFFTSCGDDDDDDDSLSQKNEVINVNGKDYDTTFFMTQEGFSTQTTTKANSLLPISPRKVAQRRCISSHSVLIQNLNLKLVMISLKRTLDYLSRLVISLMNLTFHRTRILGM